MKYLLYLIIEEMVIECGEYQMKPLLKIIYVKDGKAIQNSYFEIVFRTIRRVLTIFGSQKLLRKGNKLRKNLLSSILNWSLFFVKN
jgi:hypothetical protein